jgi:hypothetical protein
MSLRSDELFKMGLLIDEIRLQKEKSGATAVVCTSIALKPIALSI